MKRDKGVVHSVVILRGDQMKTLILLIKTKLIVNENKYLFIKSIQYSNSILT